MTMTLDDTDEPSTPPKPDTAPPEPATASAELEPEPNSPDEDGLGGYVPV